MTQIIRCIFVNNFRVIKTKTIYLYSILAFRSTLNKTNGNETFRLRPKEFHVYTVLFVYIN